MKEVQNKIEKETDIDLRVEEFKKLKEKIWKTYKTRMITAKRLLDSSKKLEFLSAYYTIFLTIYSVFGIISNEKIIGYTSTLMSIAVMGFVFWGNTMNYKDRYIKMKENYLKLDNLYHLCISEEIEHTYNYVEIRSKYEELLTISENHDYIDYITFLYKDGDLKEKLTKDKKLLYIVEMIWKKILMFLAIVIPIILTVFFAIMVFSN
jgi:hypothetical protein